MDDPTRLTPQMTKKFVDWLQQEGFDNTCPVCSNRSWNTGAHILSGATSPAIGQTSVPHYPMAFITCDRCFYVRHFMAIGIGLVDAGPEPSPAAGEADE